MKSEIIGYHLFVKSKPIILCNLLNFGLNSEGNNLDEYFEYKLLKYKPWLSFQLEIMKMSQFYYLLRNGKSFFSQINANGRKVVVTNQQRQSDAATKYTDLKIENSEDWDETYEKRM